MHATGLLYEGCRLCHDANLIATARAIQKVEKRMISFILTVLRVLKASTRAWSDERFRATLFLAAILLLSGTIFYRSVEHWSWLDSLYFCVTTMSTVGFGDLSPATEFGKFFTIFYIFAGVGIFVSLFAQMARALIEGNARKPNGDAQSNQPGTK